MSVSVLVVGKGAREHALAWRLSKSQSVKQVFVFPGNGGTSFDESTIEQNVAPISNLTGIRTGCTRYSDLAQKARQLDVGLVVVGPDDDVVNGIEEYFREARIPCFAPSRKAAQLEGSKVFAKTFMKKYGIPTATHSSFDDFDEASAYVRRVFTDDDHRIVIKADGLAAGKGVVLPETPEQALEDLRSIMKDGVFSTAGSSVVIEEYMEGLEVSILTFSDGNTFFSLPAGQDDKRILEGNKGPNTGAMGCPFQGLLFTGVMVTKSGPKVIEYNVRLGDPETQSSMLLLSEETDLASILLSCTTGTLDQVKRTIKVKPGFACNVVIASGGYPGDYETGKTISLRTPPDGVIIFHAGTHRDEGGDRLLRTVGGRVFSVAAYGDTLQQARDKSYQGVECVSFEPKVFRIDIAQGV
ncbi:phosphoribosylamine-glycine ligase [Fusarium sporotrichioides]|uniref:phosphoribosylamine--glycine ligase n=1 Tax=Fusarium sporotrichioides TaxID=5514 RepID=A0A395RI28_FUSSP|nr:phosphoribosylamine-glycine ligase [Fusarium sporotrichioides]